MARKKELQLGTKKCLQCGKIIKLKIRRDLERKKFCSKNCLAKYYSEKNILRPDWNDKELAERMKKAMHKPHKITEKLLKAARERGEKRKGTRIRSKEIICEYCGKRFYIAECRINGEVGKNGYKQLRKYCSNKCKTLASRKPDELKTEKVRLQEWGIKVFQRDNYKCVECGCSRKRLLQAHHKKSKDKYLELAYDINNGQTLCVYCHIKKHKNLPVGFMLSSLHLKGLQKPFLLPSKNAAEQAEK